MIKFFFQQLFDVFMQKDITSRENVKNLLKKSFANETWIIDKEKKESFNKVGLLRVR